jgi:signal transduction histidine kinase
MKDITPNSLIKGPIKEDDREDRNNKEFIHTMQSHFIRNDLQKIVFILELVKMGNRGNLEEQIEQIRQVCNRAKKKLETISRIHRVIHSNYTPTEESSSLIEIMEEIGSIFDFSLRIDYDSINYQIKADEFFKELLYELLSFIKNSHGGQVGISGRRCPNKPEYFVLRISESKNALFSKDICEKLLQGLNAEEWDYLGNNIEITLSSMIASYYGGKLTIHSSPEIGNCYSIFIPFSICTPNSIN